MRFLFDFDGVLMNSCREAALTAFRAVTREPVTQLVDLPPGCLRLFERNRHFFVPAGEALPLMRWCISKLSASHDSMLSETEWNEVKARETIPVRERGRVFFAARQEIVDHDKQAWLPLSEPYQPIWNALKPIAHDVIILTNKNRSAVVDLTEFWKFPVRPENIFAADGGVSKTDNLGVIFDSTPGKDWMFIDDQLTNLLKIREFISLPQQRARYNSFELALAEWGYSDDNMRRSSSAEKIPVLSQEDVIRSIAGDIA